MVFFIYLSSLSHLLGPLSQMVQEDLEEEDGEGIFFSSTWPLC